MTVYSDHRGSDGNELIEIYQPRAYNFDLSRPQRPNKVFVGSLLHVSRAVNDDRMILAQNLKAVSSSRKIREVWSVLFCDTQLRLYD